MKYSILLLLLTMMTMPLAYANNPILPNNDFSSKTKALNGFIDEKVEAKQLLQTQVCSQTDGNSFHLFSHGQSGQLLINNEWLLGEDLVNFLQPLLHDKTQVNIYGCNFAQGETGRAAVAYLETALGVSIAASDDITGVDGDWDLEVGKAKGININIAYNYNLQACNAVPTPSSNIATNLALSGTATASSELDATLYPASNGNDDIINGGNFYHSIAVATDSEPWWMVDLGAEQAIGEIKFYNRAGNESRADGIIFEILDATNAVIFTQTIATAGFIESIPVPLLNGQYVRVRLESTVSEPVRVLNFSEVAVMSARLPSFNNTPVTCTNNISNDDGIISFFDITFGDAFHYSIGNIFDDNGGANTYTNAQAITGTMAQTANVIPNPAVPTDYTVRIYDGSNSCFIDLVTTIDPKDCTQACFCKDYIYLNEPAIGAVLKFEVTPNLELIEVVGTNGGTPPNEHWYPGTGASELPSPHGLGVDLNGNLYIGSNFASNTPIRQFNCDGDIKPVDATTINNDFILTSMFSIGSTIYTSRSGGPAAYNSCTGDFIGAMCLNDANGDPLPVINTGDPQNVNWGLSYNKTTEMVYVSGQGGDRRGIWRFTKAELEAGTTGGTDCIDIFIPFSTTAAINVGDNFLPNSNLYNGIVSDNSGNIYILSLDGSLHKYDSNGGYLASAAQSSNYEESFGLIWSESNNYLYIANQTDNPVVDCISAFDANTLAYLGAAAPNPNLPANNAAKALAIVRECCPNQLPPSSSINVCGESNAKFFLNEEMFADCPEGIVCGSSWTPMGTPEGMTFDPCDNSVTVTGLGCSTFSLNIDAVVSTGCPTQSTSFTICNIERPIITTRDTTICNGNMIDVSLLASTTSGTLTFHSASPADGSNALASTTISPSMDSTIYVLATNGTCTEMDSIMITHTIPDTVMICSDASNSATITTQTGLTGVEWFNSAGTSVGTGDVVIVDINTAGMDDGNDSFYYTALDGDGCAIGICCPIVVESDDCATFDFSDYAHPTNTCTTPACHIISTDLYLGSGVTAEDVPNINQTADSDIDDGVMIPPNMSFVRGNTVHLPVEIYNNIGMDAYLRIWIDWNGDGDFEDAGEQVEDNDYPSTGVSNIVHVSITIPTTATQTTPIALRARLSTDDANSATPCGTGTCAANGEVEDYLIQINCPAPICLPVTITKNF